MGHTVPHAIEKLSTIVFHMVLLLQQDWYGRLKIACHLELCASRLVDEIRAAVDAYQLYYDVPYTV